MAINEIVRQSKQPTEAELINRANKIIGRSKKPDCQKEANELSSAYDVINGRFDFKTGKPKKAFLIPGKGVVYK